jgi:hypothetical protein
MCNANAWSDVNGTCQPWPIIPNSDIVYQTASLPLDLTFSGSCSQQAANALGNGLVNDLQQALAAAAVNGTFLSVIKGPCSSSSSMRREVSQQYEA